MRTGKITRNSWYKKAVRAKVGTIPMLIELAEGTPLYFNVGYRIYFKTVENGRMCSGTVTEILEDGYLFIAL